MPFFEREFYRYPRNPSEAEQDIEDFEAIARFNIGVATGIIFPFSPLSSLYKGEDSDKVITQSISGWMITELGVYSLGGAPFGAMHAARSMLTRYALANPLVAVPAAVVGGTDLYITTMEKLEPEEKTYQPSFWNSIGAALGGTFGGMSGVVPK